MTEHALQAREESGVTTREEYSSELSPTSAAAKEQFEIQGAMTLAKKFPRNEDAAFQQLMKACGRTSFAEDAEYSFPRGGQPIKGPSINLAREAGRIWGNLRFGCHIINDLDGFRQIRGWAYDLQTNTKVEAEDGFKKLVFRKNKGWVEPDERDLRELTNRRAAILIRNCILSLLPKDLIEDALETVHNTLKERAAKDPDGERKKVLTAFSGLNITAEMLEAYLRHPLAQSSPAEIADLRSVYKSIADGNSTWAEYVSPTVEDIKDKTKEKAASLKEKLAAEPEPAPEVSENVLESPVDDLTDLRTAITDLAASLGMKPTAKQRERAANVDSVTDRETLMALYDELKKLED